MSDTAFVPDWVSPPGDTMSDLLDEEGLSLDEFARQLGEDSSFASRLLHGHIEITEGIARSLVHVLGASEGFWLTREKHYRDNLRRLVQAQDTDDGRRWLSEIPASELVALGWVDSRTASLHKTTACLRFFGVPSPEAWRDVFTDVLGAVAFRTSETYASYPGAVAAWLRQGEIMAASIGCRRWNAERLTSSLDRIRSLTRQKEPHTFIPALQAIGADAGVAIVVLRTPSKCRASGAIRVLPRDRRLLLLSFRYLSDDHFWFTVFHEIGHLLLHPEAAIIIEDEEGVAAEREHEANAFAADILIPAKHREAMRALPVDGHRVMRFAKKVGVSPGIVVGQMQHAGWLRPNQLNNLKRRYAWEEE